MERSSTLASGKRFLWHETRLIDKALTSSSLAMRSALDATLMWLQLIASRRAPPTDVLSECNSLLNWEVMMERERRRIAKQNRGCDIVSPRGEARRGG